MRARKLNSQELWERVTALENQTIYTLKHRRPNFVEEVGDSSIRIKGRRSRIARAQIEQVYDNLCRIGEFRMGLRDWTGKINRLRRVVPAIVLAAVPEQAEMIHDDGPSGIRLKQQR